MPSSHGFRPLAYTLIRRIVLVATLCMVAMGGLSAALAYRELRQAFDHTVHTIAGSSLQALSSALWDIEVHAVQEQVDWLAKRPEIGWVKVEAAIGRRFVGGDEARAETGTSIVLEILANDGASLVGTLEIAANRDRFREQMVRRVTEVVIHYMVYTLLICLAVGWILRRELQDPLQQIARFAASLQPRQLARPLSIDRRRRHGVDEIDLVVAGFRRLQADLRHHIEALDETVAERTRQLSEMVDEVKRLSVTDPLTACYNRRYLDQHLPAEMERSFRYQRPLSVVFIDLDHFKRINDRFGHEAGDQVLREIVARLMQSVREHIDWVARFGGEEFVIVLPERGRDGAREMAERMRRLVAATPVRLGERTLEVTASCGVAEYQRGDRAAELLARADAALYQAKAQGRNRVVVAGEALRPAAN